MITKPNDVANYFPLNQNDTIVICAVINDSQNIPNRARPASIPPKELAETAIEITNWEIITPSDNMTTAALHIHMIT